MGLRATSIEGDCMALKEIKGDIWKFWKGGHYIVIPTNGSINKYGECVMGIGLAKQAKQLLVDLPMELGNKISISGNVVFVFRSKRLITFPVKTRWHEKASLELIRESCAQIARAVELDDSIRVPIYMPKVGCGYGGLDWEDVKSVLDECLDEKTFVICDLKK